MCAMYIMFTVALFDCCTKKHLTVSFEKNIFTKTAQPYLYETWPSKKKKKKMVNLPGRLIFRNMKQVYSKYQMFSVFKCVR